jgi:hypothetical protein
MLAKRLGGLLGRHLLTLLHGRWGRLSGRHQQRLLHWPFSGLLG